MICELKEPSKAASLFADWEDPDAGVAACLDNVMGRCEQTVSPPCGKARLQIQPRIRLLRDQLKKVNEICHGSAH